jgi:hypothetical protein
MLGWGSQHLDLIFAKRHLTTTKCHVQIFKPTNISNLDANVGPYLHRDWKYLLHANILNANQNAAFIMCPSYNHKYSQQSRQQQQQQQPSSWPATTQ